MHTVYLGKDQGELKMTSQPRGERGEQWLQPNLLSPATAGPPIVRPQAMGRPVRGPKKAAGAGYFSFSTSPAKSDYELVGIPRLRLSVRPMESKAQINGLLYDLPPDEGTPQLITYGTITLDNLVSGEEQAVTMDLVAVDYLLKQGHRFRLTLSGTNTTFFLPVLGDGVKVIYGNGDSTLDLPLRRVDAD
jgi:predicted acyl esterase